MYTDTNFKTKKALKEAVARGEKVTIYQPGGMFDPPENKPDFSGTAFCEGPHFPAAHSWYATVEMRDGVVVKVK